MNSIKFVIFGFQFCLCHLPRVRSFCGKVYKNFVGIFRHLPGVGTAEGTVAMVPLADGLSSNYELIINNNKFMINVGNFGSFHI